MLRQGNTLCEANQNLGMYFYFIFSRPEPDTETANYLGGDAFKLWDRYWLHNESGPPEVSGQGFIRQPATVKGSLSSVE